MASVGSPKQPQVDYGRGYSDDIETIRKEEYPLLNGNLSSSDQVYCGTDHPQRQRILTMPGPPHMQSP